MDQSTIAIDRNHGGLAVAIAIRTQKENAGFERVNNSFGVIGRMQRYGDDIG
jgi:hypothetical protein